MGWSEVAIFIIHHKTIYRPASELNFRSTLVRELFTINFSQLPNKDFPSSWIQIVTRFTRMIFILIKKSIICIEYSFQPSTLSTLVCRSCCSFFLCLTACSLTLYDNPLLLILFFKLFTKCFSHFVNKRAKQWSTLITGKGNKTL